MTSIAVPPELVANSNEFVAVLTTKYKTVLLNPAGKLPDVFNTNAVPFAMP